MTITSDIRQRFVAARHATVKASLRDSLRFLQMNVGRALESLEKGEPCDQHIIQNAGQITAEVALWNMLRDIKAFEDAEVDDS